MNSPIRNPEQIQAQIDAFTTTLPDGWKTPPPADDFAATVQWQAWQGHLDELHTELGKALALKVEEHFSKHAYELVIEDLLKSARSLPIPCPHDFSDATSIDIAIEQSLIFLAGFRPSLGFFLQRLRYQQTEVKSFMHSIPEFAGVRE